MPGEQEAGGAGVGSQSLRKGEGEQCRQSRLQVEEAAVWTQRVRAVNVGECRG